MLNWTTWKYQAGAALLAAAFVAPSALAAAPVLNIVATPGSAAVGSSIELDIRINGVTDLFGYNFSLLFNPANLQLTSVSEGSFLSSDNGPTDFGVADAEGTPGLVYYVYGSKFDTVPGISGSGSLAHLSFNVIGAGTSTLSFSDLLFLNAAQGDITPQWAPQTLVTTAVPEPEAYLMLGVGLLGLAALRRRQLG